MPGDILNYTEDTQEKPLYKRSYSLRASTLKMLDELKVFVIKEPTDLSTIVDNAIRYYYAFKKNEKTNEKI